MLSPALVTICRELSPRPSTVSEDDVQQQVVVDVLTAAARIPLKEPPLHMERRLLLYACTYSVRWLVRELRREKKEVSEDLEPTPIWSPDEEQDAFDLIELAGGSPDDELIQLYKRRVLRTTLAELGRERGESTQKADDRQRRAMTRLRRQVA